MDPRTRPSSSARPRPSSADYGSELVQDCVQIHGGIGLTFDHDVHLFLRRHTVDRALYGTPAEHRQRLADLVEAKGDTP